MALTPVFPLRTMTINELHKINNKKVQMFKHILDESKKKKGFQIFTS